MKIHAIVILALTTIFVSCAKWDKPSISIEHEEYLVDSNGGEITIPVTSTHIDDVSVAFDYYDRWNIDSNNGDRTPKDPWITVSQIIENFPQTKALASWRSGVVLTVEPNESAEKREATVIISSFTKTASVKVIQTGRQWTENH